MASCMECIHFNPCNVHGKIIVEKPTEGNDWALHNNVESECQYFKPTADVVEVVRCEDCQHKEQCPESLIIEGKDKYLVFCSCGEKRDGNKHAHWEYWSGWAGNHDQRIEDATCSNCGYKHPTVRLDYVDGKFIKGYVPDKLAKECPNCGAKMDE